MAGGGHGGHGHYPGYPSEVWTPAGGWYADPKRWRRNTFVAMTGIFVICVPIFLASVKLERRPLPPTKPIPSQLWSNRIAKPAREE